MNKDTLPKRFIVDIQDNYSSSATSSPLPEEKMLQRWVCSVFEQEHLISAELTLRFVAEAEMLALNTRYRDKKALTNVLSFSAIIPASVSLEVPLLGDVILCVPVIAQEAKEQKKPLFAHWAHLVIHGTLHLLNYDHQNDQEALIMEAKEISLLRQFHYLNPYSEA